MQALFVFLCLALPAAASGGAEVFRWVDAEGQVHYSDRPSPGADRVAIDVVPPSSTPVAGGSSPERTGSATGPGETAVAYEALSIQAPAQDETLWNIEGQLDVAVAPQPGLQPGHRIQLLLDGQTAEELEPGQTRTRLSDVYRGQHTLLARITDEFGTTLKQSELVTFQVQQPSQQNPNRAVNPPLPTPRPRVRP
ncbi:MAG: DUF4124 domain-containing protein [Gammaproteobacteria bacterium]|nr:DUF4124 domain-containing protein [Gammaproteobacteria bacterium]